MPLLLDTTVLIDALRGRSARRRVLALRDIGEVPYVCAVSVDEVARGLRFPDRAPAWELLHSLQLAPLGVEEGWRAGTWRADFAAQGVTLSQADCLIAAAAFGVGRRLATCNPRDFPMTELVVEHWEAGR